MVQTRRVELAVPVEEAYQRVLEAFGSVGKVDEASELTRSVRGRVRYGWGGKIRTRVSVLTGAVPHSAVLEVETKSQDVWGTSGRRAADSLIEALG